MAVYNVSKIENWYDDFTSCKNKFLNTYAEDYKNSYIKACKDDIANKMRVSLNNNYNRINRIFNNIDKYWKNYLNDLKNTDNCLAGNAKPSSVTVSSVSSKLSQLPELDIYESDLGTKIESVSSVIGTAKGLGWAEDRTLKENLAYVGKRTGATIATLGVSVVEGLGKLVENLGDLSIIANAAVSTIGTGVIDLVNYFRADLTGDESLKTNYTDQLWETTRAVVSQDITGTIFDSLYQNTGLQTLQENAYGFDTVRAIGTEVGEVIGVVALSAIPGVNVAAWQIYGAEKMAEHTEENWQDPTKDTFEGLVQGTFEGFADGLFFAIGAKGDKVFSSVLTSGSKSAGKTILSLLGKTAFESGTSVAQDFVNITVDALFLPDQVIGENNEIINLDTFEAKMNYSFDQAGGVNGILTSMGTAGMLSFMSDGLDAAKIMRNVDTNNALKNADINSSKLKDTTGNVTKQIDELTSKINALDDNHINYFNDRIRKGNAVEIKVPSADDIPDNIWEKIDRPKYDDKDVWITTADGKKFYWGEDTNPNMLRNNNTNIKSVSTSANDAASSVKSSRPNTNIDTPETSNIAAKNSSVGNGSNKAVSNSQSISSIKPEIHTLSTTKNLPDLSGDISEYAKLFDNSKNGKSIQQVVDDMQKNGLMDEFNKASNDIDNLYNGPKPIGEHDATHVKNVLFYSMNMGHDLNLSKKELDMLIDSAKYHDVGIVNASSHNEHAIRSANILKNDLQGKYSDLDLRKMQAIVEYHEMEDILRDANKKPIKMPNSNQYKRNNANFDYVCSKYGITNPSDIEQVRRLGDILKDADAIDRTRFPGNMDTGYFRNYDVSNSYLKSSYELREAIAKEDLIKSMNSGRYSKQDVEEVIKLLNTEKYPYQIIDFSLKYHKNKGLTITDMVNNYMRYANQNINVIKPDAKSINKYYIDNITEMKKNGISYEQYAADHGIEIKNYSGEMEVAVDLGDENWYLVQVLRKNKSSMTPNQQNVVDALCNKPRSELNTANLLNIAGPYLTKQDLDNLQKMDIHPNMANLTLQNKNTLHSYQNAGGCEVNGMLRGKDYSWANIYSIQDLENMMNNGYLKKIELPNGDKIEIPRNTGHTRIINDNYTIIDEIDDIIKYNSNTTTIKGVSYLNSVGPKAPTDRVLDIIQHYGSYSDETLHAIHDLIGLDITDSAFNSKTIPPNRETTYSKKFNNYRTGDPKGLDIKVESYISPGCGAYIDTYGGVTNGIGEMLLKRDCKQTIIDAYIDPKTGKLVLVTLYE